MRGESPAAGAIAVGTSPRLTEKRCAFQFTFADPHAQLPMIRGMKTQLFRKVLSLDQLTQLAHELHSQGRQVVLCHGCFDIVHPGHLRYLQSAGSHGDVLVVSLTSDDAIEKSDGTRPYIPQEYRAENLAALEFVDHVVVVDGPTAEPVIKALRPNLYVKGREYERSADPRIVAERALVEAAGGRVMFSSGDVVFSSTTIMDSLGDRFAQEGWDDLARLRANCQRWAINLASLNSLIDSFSGARVAVVGDAICDDYVFCEAIDVANEAPCLSLKPKHEAAYLGGAAVIAAHLQGLGAQAHLLTTVADDEPSRQLLDTLDQMKVQHTALRVRPNLPVKQRFLADRQKLLKVDRGDPHPLDSADERKLQDVVVDLANNLDALIFADFGYGTVTASLLDALLKAVRTKIRVIAGDVSGPRRTLLSMKQVDLLTPTERELRGVLGDFERSLPTVAAELMQRLRTPNLIAKLGPRGAVLFHPRNPDPSHWFEGRLRCEYLPALTDRADDVVGAGDALLATVVLALTRGATLPQAGYLGSQSAALAISRIGNLPLSRADLRESLRRRPELMGRAPEQTNALRSQALAG